VTKLAHFTLGFLLGAVLVAIATSFPRLLSSRSDAMETSWRLYLEASKP